MAGDPGIPSWAFLGLPLSVLGIVFLGLAAWVLWLNPRHAGTRAFAIYLTARGVSAILYVGSISHDDSLAYASYWLGALTAGALLLSVIWFGSRHPRARGLGTSTWGGVALTIVGVALAAVAFVDPQSVYSLAPRAGGGYAIASFGPLEALEGAAWLVSGILMLRFALDARAARAPEERSSLRLIAIAFGLDLGYRGLASAFVLANVNSAFVYDASPTSRALTALSLIPALIGTLILSRRDSGGSWRTATIIAIAPALAIVIYVGSIALEWRAFVSSTLRLVLPVVVVYSLVKYRLFDIDLRIKWTIRRGTLAAMFLAVFFVVAQVAQNYLNANTSLGWAAGGVVAGLLLFAISPLQRVAERVADAAMPRVHDTTQYRSERQEQVYRTAVRLALADRVITNEEEAHLAELATELGLAPVDALRLRRSVETELGVVLGDHPAVSA